MNIVFRVPASPVAQPRHRAAVVNGMAMTYEAPKSAPIHAFKATCRVAYAHHVDSGPFAGPLELKLWFVFPRPASRTRKRNQHQRLWHASRPDCDNLAKAVLDALNGLAWVDDSQVARLNVEKVYGLPQDAPHVLVAISALEGEGPTCEPSLTELANEADNVGL